MTLLFIIQQRPFTVLIFFPCVIAFLGAQYFAYSLHQGIRESTMRC